MSDANTTDPNVDLSSEQPLENEAPAPRDNAASVVTGEVAAAALAADHALAAAEYERCQQELQAANDRAVRWQAELENFRKRTRREMEEQSRFAALPLLQDLLGVVDDLQRAIEAAENSAAATPEQTSGLREGVKMVAAHMASVLGKHHCEPIEALGLPFDPHLHEAIGQIPHDQYAAGLVALVARQGYHLHERVVRPAQVLVSLGPAAGSSTAAESTGAE